MPKWPVHARIDGPIVMIGFGSIGKGSLPLIERHFHYDKKRFVVIDPEDKDRKLLDQRGIAPLGLYRGIAVAGLAPEEMGIGPVFAVPKLLKQHGLSVDDIGLWELNEAFACQVLYSAQKLGIDPAKLNVNGGAIALGHPLGCTGSKLATTLLFEMQRRNVEYGIVTMCIGGGMGAAGIFQHV